MVDICPVEVIIQMYAVITQTIPVFDGDLDSEADIDKYTAYSKKSNQRSRRKHNSICPSFHMETHT